MCVKKDRILMESIGAIQELNRINVCTTLVYDTLVYVSYSDRSSHVMS